MAYKVDLIDDYSKAKKKLWWSKIFFFVSFIPTIVFTIFFSYLYFIDGNPPVEFKNIPFPTDKKVYQQGENVKMYLDVCKYKNANATSYIQFSNYYLYHLSPISFRGIATGCEKLYSSPIAVPDKLEAGEYKLQGRNEYKVNFLRTRSVDWESQMFEVVEK